MQKFTSMAMLLLLLLTFVMKFEMASAAVADPASAERGRARLSRGFRFGGADRFSHGFGRRRRVDDTVINPLT